MIAGCSADSTDGIQASRVDETPLELPEAEAVSQPPAATALTVLPSIDEVLVAVPEWRTDHFAPFRQRNSVGPELGG